MRYLNLLSSTSTLFCCALPSLFVALGLGASFAGLLSNFPQLLWIGDHKEVVFGFASTMLAYNGYEQFKKIPSCSIDSDTTSPSQTMGCQNARKRGRIIWVISLLFYSIGIWFSLS